MLCAVTHGEEESKSTDCTSDAVNRIQLGGFIRSPQCQGAIMVELLLVIILVIVLLRIV